ncbi:MAG: pseudouridine synthase [Bradyrhizobiaceae bacterium]|nr:MAG: pseudouridine synthase [Bradyrhizobiaceae bacterium]
MPRDNDKNNRSGSGSRSRPPGRGRDGESKGRGRFGDERPARSSAPRGDRKFGEKKFGDKKPGGRSFGEKRPYAAKGEGFRKDGDRPRPRFDRDDRPARGDRSEGRPFKPREDRGDRPARGPRKEFGAGNRGEGRSFKPREDRAPRGERSDARPSRSGGYGDKKFGEKRPYTPRGEDFRKDGDRPRPRFDRDDRPQRDDRPRGEERPRFNRDDRGPSRGPRREFGDRNDRSNEKPWEKRAPRRDDRGGSDRPRFSRPREDRPEGGERFERKREGFGRPRFERDGDDRAPRRNAWQEHPRSESRSRGDRDERPRRDNEDDSKIFAKRPAFGGRGAYRERPADSDKRAPRAAPKKDKTGERIAKAVARAGLCSRRDAEEWITQGRVAVNGRVINSPALDVTVRDVITIDGKPLPERERTRLFLYHKPRGLMTTHDDPEGRPTVFDHLPEGLPRLISIGRLDFNTEGLLLLTNDGGLSRALEHPDTGWLRRYRVRAHGEVTQAQLDELKNGVEVDGVKYGSIDATLERDQGANVWVTFAIREGKNREVRNVMAHLGLEVNRLIRVSYGPFQLGEIPEGQVEEIKSRVLREQLGEKIATMSGAQFDKPVREDEGPKVGRDGTPLRSKADNKKIKRSKIEDRKGRTVVVQRSGSDEKRARNEAEANGYGPPRKPKRGYHGKRDLTPKD